MKLSALSPTAWGPKAHSERRDGATVKMLKMLVITKNPWGTRKRQMEKKKQQVSNLNSDLVLTQPLTYLSVSLLFLKLVKLL